VRGVVVIAVLGPLAVGAVAFTKPPPAANQRAQAKPPLADPGDAEIGGSLDVNGRDVANEIESLQKEMQALKTKLTAAEASITKLTADLTRSTVRIAVHEWVFGLGNVGQGTPLKAPLNNWVPDLRWGSKVIGVILTPTGNPNEIVSLSHLAADVYGENQIRLTISPIPGRNVLIRIRATIFYLD
jgi:hypothetical protein